MIWNLANHQKLTGTEMGRATWRATLKYPPEASTGPRGSKGV